MANTLKIAPDLYSKPPVAAYGGARQVFRSVSLLTTDLVTTQLIALGVLPAGHRLGAFFVESEDLDTHTTPTITLDIGILNTYYNEAEAASGAAADYNNQDDSTQSGGQATTTNTGTEPALVTGHNLATASTICQAGGRLTGPYPTTLTPAYDIGVDSAKDRIIAIAFSTVPATATTGVLGIGFTIDQD
jgi:hypothetical protein